MESHLPLDEQFESNFPKQEEFIDHSGKSRRFEITLRRNKLGDFHLEAIELASDEGYQFEVWGTSDSIPQVSSALGRLRSKIRIGIATKYLHRRADGAKELTHDTLKGRISHRGLVIDGEFLSFEELNKVLDTYEGFGIEMRITSSSD